MDSNLYKYIGIVIFIIAVIMFANEFIFFNDKFYNGIKAIDNPDDIELLVNKNKKLRIIIVNNYILTPLFHFKSFKN